MARFPTLPLPTPLKLKFGRKRYPALLSAGIKIRACAITPKVVPNPSKFNCEVVTELAVGTAVINEIKIAAVAITIMLFTIGAYIGSEKELREFKICEANV